MGKFLTVVMAGLIAAAMFGCQSTPVTVAPYAGYGGFADGFNGAGSGYPNSWQVGVGMSFTLGGQGGYVTPVPGHPSLPQAPARVQVDNSNSTNQTQTQNQGQVQTGGHNHHNN